MMIEVLFALSIVVIALLALMGAAVSSLKNARHSKNMVLANHYAQQAMENTRAFKNRNVFDNLVENCYDESTPSALSTPLGDFADCDDNTWGADDIDDIFKRRIRIDDETLTDRKKITVSIGWQDSDCATGVYCHKAEIVGYLSKWSN